jgi:hypothetical protein
MHKKLRQIHNPVGALKMLVKHIPSIGDFQWYGPQRKQAHFERLDLFS